MPTSKENQTYTIKYLAREFDITARTLRYYEDQGLLSPKREGQTRIYNNTDKARLAWVLRGKRVGFSLNDITEMLDLYDLSDGREKQREVTLEKCKEQIKSLKTQRDDIDATITELSGFIDEISTLIHDPSTGKLTPTNKKAAQSAAVSQ